MTDTQNLLTRLRALEEESATLIAPIARVVPAATIKEIHDALRDARLEIERLAERREEPHGA